MFETLSDQDIFGFLQLKEKEVNGSSIDFEDEIILETRSNNIETKRIFLKSLAEQEATYFVDRRTKTPILQKALKRALTWQ